MARGAFNAWQEKCFRSPGCIQDGLDESPHCILVICSYNTFGYSGTSEFIYYAFEAMYAM